MHGDLSTLTLVALTFVLAGFVKGVVGVGLPTVAIGLLSLTMLPAQAAALLILPTLVTNVWQALAGARLLALIRRLWPMLLGIGVGTWLGGKLLTLSDSERAITALGCILVLYAVVGLTPVRFSVPARAQPWLSPVIGALTGAASAATGVFMVPAVPYLQALALDKDDLVQAIGLSVTVSTLALALLLTGDGILKISTAGASVLALAPALAGMLLGQAVRDRVQPEVFRVCFFIGLLLLGTHLALRAVF